MPNAFVDTNVLVYAAHEVLPTQEKTLKARALLLQRDLVLSVQVLSEFTVTARNTAKLNLSRTQEKDWISRWLLFPIVPLTVETYLAAQRVHLQYQLSHWDSLIVAAALASNSEILYSEDLNHGQNVDGVEIINPFLP